MVIGIDKKTYGPTDSHIPGPGYYNDQRNYKELTKGPIYSIRIKTNKECNLGPFDN